MKNKYSQKAQLSEGVYVFEDGNKAWGGEMNHNFELLNEKLKNKSLTLKMGGSVIGTYDSTSDVEVDMEIAKITNNDIDSMFVGD